MAGKLVQLQRQRSRKPGTLLFIALVAITLVGPLSIHMFLPALPHVRHAFAVDEATAQLTFSLAMMVMAFATLVYGSLSDQYGRLPVLLGGLALFSLGALIAVMAPNISVLIIGRLVQGAGAACGLVLARVIIRDVYGLHKLGKMIAYLTAAYVIGPLTAPLIGGLLTDYFGWQSILILPAIFGVVAIVIALVIIGETGSPSRTVQPNLIDSYWRLFAKRLFVLYAFAPPFGSGAFFALGTAAAYLTIEVLGRSTTEFGLLFMFGPAGYLAGNYLSGRLDDRFPRSFLIIVGSVISLCGAAVLIILTTAIGITMFGIFGPFALLSIGQGLVMPHSQAAAIAQQPTLTGTASGIVVFLQFMFIAGSTQLVSILSDGTATPMLVVVTACTVLGFACSTSAVTLSKRRPPDC